MIKKLVFSVIFIFGTISPVQAQTINVNKLCASIINIPYASDNFTDEEWEEFKQCVIFVNQFSE